MNALAALFVFGAFVVYVDAVIKRLPKLPEPDTEQYAFNFPDEEDNFDLDMN